jgi:hypothetical protein
MTRQIRVTAIYNKEPDIRRYVLALIELARQLQDEETTASAHRAAKQEHTTDV